MRIILAAAAFIFSAAPSLPTLAQDVGGSGEPSLTLSGETGASSTVETPNAGPLDAQLTGDNSYTGLIAAINATGAVDLSGITEDSKVNVVLVSTLTGDAATEGAALDAALAAQADVLSTLRTEIINNAAIGAALAAAGHEAERVIAIRTDSNGNVLVYVDDRD